MGARWCGVVAVGSTGRWWRCWGEAVEVVEVVREAVF
jgi:hypothetical protein